MRADLDRHTVLVLWTTIIVSALVVVTISAAAAHRMKPRPPCVTAAADFEVDGSIWRLSGQRGLFFHARERTVRLDHRHNPPTFCVPRAAAPIRIDGFGLTAEALRQHQLANPQDFAALQDVSLLVVGGRARRFALPQARLGEAYGPRLFGRPTVYSCRPFRNGAGREFPWCRLSSWLPDGVPVSVTYEDDGDDLQRAMALEALIATLRR
ncbi:MAG: hypothetical protein ACOY5Y_02195 [Pseudomonadota bacterium]